MSKKTEQSMYDLSAIIDTESLESVRTGSSLLISGPAMTGKEQLMLDVLADGLRQDEGAVAMTTGRRAEAIAEDLKQRYAEMDAHALSVMDCRSEGSREETTLDGGVYAHHVSAPSDITGIGIGVTRALERLSNGGYDRGRLGLTSLSTMLTYADEETVFKFCHVLSSRLDAAEYLGAFTIDSSAHGERTLQVIKQAFDGQIELREHEGERQARVRGLHADPSDWHPL